MTTRLRAWIQHGLNELVIYCRLKDCGLDQDTAKRWGRAIGRWIGPFLYGRRK